MVDKVYHMTPCEEFQLSNQFPSDRPIIGICFDWRKDATTHKYSYVKSIIQDYKNAIENAGGELYVLSFEDDIGSFRDKVDGIIIPGGRDLHPKYYGQEIHGSMVGDVAEIHYEFNKTVYTGLPKECPILGICWGFQFLNVINGGSLIQDMHDKAEHFKKRRMQFVEGSWLHEIVGSSALGNCYHHQALDKLGKNVVVTGIDDHSMVPHALEVKEEGRTILGIHWHPEITFTNESREQHSEDSQKIFSSFVKICADYKSSKIN
jgi:putative glutamine amidotransferase